MQQGVYFGTFTLACLYSFSTFYMMHKNHLISLKRDIKWLQEEVTFNKTHAAEFSMHAATEKYYLDHAQRCTEEMERINEWNNNGIVMRTFKSPPYVDYMYIDSGIRFN
jgi:hypothetical protein